MNTVRCLETQPKRVSLLLTRTWIRSLLPLGICKDQDEVLASHPFPQQGNTTCLAQLGCIYRVQAQINVLTKPYFQVLDAGPAEYCLNRSARFFDEQPTCVSSKFVIFLRFHQLGEVDFEEN